MSALKFRTPEVVHEFCHEGKRWRVLLSLAEPEEGYFIEVDGEILPLRAHSALGAELVTDAFGDALPLHLEGGRLALRRALIEFYEAAASFWAGKGVPRLSSACGRAAFLLKTPHVSSLCRKATKEEVKRLFHKTQRAMEEKLLGDPYLVVQEPDKVYRAISMYHIRGLWGDAELREVREIIRKLKAMGLEKSKRTEEGRTLWRRLLHPSELAGAYMLADLETVRKAVQKVFDRRGDTSAALDRFMTHDYRKVETLENLEERIVNRANNHIDLRMWSPPYIPPRWLIGWTLISSPVVLQWPRRRDFEVLLRDKFIDNKAYDRIITARKARQPVIWFHIVSPKRRMLIVEPGEIGGTKYTGGTFVFLDYYDLLYGIQKSGRAHEYFLSPERHEKAFGRWIVRHLPSRPEYEKAGQEGFFWQMWKPEDHQEPYIVLHAKDAKQKIEEAKKEGFAIVANTGVIPALKKHPKLRKVLKGIPEEVLEKAIEVWKVEDKDPDWRPPPPPKQILKEGGLEVE